MMQVEVEANSGVCLKLLVDPDKHRILIWRFKRMRRIYPYATEALVKNPNILFETLVKEALTSCNEKMNLIRQVCRLAQNQLGLCKQKNLRLTMTNMRISTMTMVVETDTCCIRIGKDTVTIPEFGVFQLEGRWDLVGFTDKAKLHKTPSGLYVEFDPDTLE